MSRHIPKYLATCESDGELNYEVGTGDTPEDGLNDYQFNHLASFASYEGMAPGRQVNVFIHLTKTPADADCSPEEVDPNWLFCMGGLFSTVSVEVPHD